MLNQSEREQSLSGNIGSWLYFNSIRFVLPVEDKPLDSGIQHEVERVRKIDRQDAKEYLAAVKAYKWSCRT